MLENFRRVKLGQNTRNLLRQYPPEITVYLRGEVKTVYAHRFMVADGKYFMANCGLKMKGKTVYLPPVDAPDTKVKQIVLKCTRCFMRRESRP